MRKIVMTIILISLIFVNAGCGTTQKTDQATGQTDGNQAQQEADIKVLALGTHGVGSVVHTLGAGISTVLSNGLEIEVKTVASSGPTEWLPMILTKEMDLGVLNNWDAQMGRQGKSSYEKTSNGKGFPIMLITSGHKSFSGIVVAGNSGIKIGKDLMGKRVAGNYAGSPGTSAQTEGSLANLGLTTKDVNMASMPSVAAGVRAIIEGRVDANGTTSMGMGTVSELDSVKGSRYISLDSSPEAVKRLQEKFPAKVEKVSPGNGIAGINEDTYLMSYPFYLVGRENLPESLVYDIVKTLWEQNKDLTIINKNLEDWTPENFVIIDNTIPFHPGAIKYYKEKKVWTADMEKHQQELLVSK